MTVDDLVLLIGKMTVEREILKQRIQELEQNVEALERRLNVATPETITLPDDG